MGLRTSFGSVGLAAGLLALACEPPPDPPGEREGIDRSGRALVGVPEDGYPNYQERLALVAINRARAAPNDVGHDSASDCSAHASATPPLMLSFAGSRAARFHTANLALNAGGLSHDSYCTLRSDVATSGCDGHADCACEAGTECWSCTTLGGCGSDPWRRTSLFGFGANGEVGAAGYGDGREAVRGWVTECPPADGHRQILTGGDKNVIGLGFTSGGSCWSSFIFGDTGYDGEPTPVLPSGVHYPESGSRIEFRTNYFARGAATGVFVVIDGVCHAMSIELGEPTNATYLATLDVGSGCHEYWFLAHDQTGAAHAYPEAGAWKAGDCTDYSPTRIETGCEGALPPDAGVVVGPDAGVRDTGSAGPDAEGASDGGAGATDAGGDAGRALSRPLADRQILASCACTSNAGATSGTPPRGAWALVLFFALVLRRSRLPIGRGPR